MDRRSARGHTLIAARRGKPVEVNALWIDGLTYTADVACAARADPSRFAALAETARRSFRARFVRPDNALIGDAFGERSSRQLETFS